MGVNFHVANVISGAEVKELKLFMNYLITLFIILDTLSTIMAKEGLLSPKSRIWSSPPTHCCSGSSKCPFCSFLLLIWSSSQGLLCQGLFPPSKKRRMWANCHRVATARKLERGHISNSPTISPPCFQWHLHSRSIEGREVDCIINHSAASSPRTSLFLVSFGQFQPWALE